MRSSPENSTLAQMEKLTSIIAHHFVCERRIRDLIIYRQKKYRSAHLRALGNLHRFINNGYLISIRELYLPKLHFPRKLSMNIQIASQLYLPAMQKSSGFGRFRKCPSSKPPPVAPTVFKFPSPQTNNDFPKMWERFHDFGLLRSKKSPT